MSGVGALRFARVIIAVLFWCSFLGADWLYERYFPDAANLIGTVFGFLGPNMTTTPFAVAIVTSLVLLAVSVFGTTRVWGVTSYRVALGLLVLVGILYTVERAFGVIKTRPVWGGWAMLGLLAGAISIEIAKELHDRQRSVGQGHSKP